MQKTLVFSLIFLTSIACFIFTLLTFRDNPIMLHALTSLRSRSTSAITLEYIDVPSVIISFPGRSERVCKAGFTLSVHPEAARQLRTPQYLQFSQATAAEIMTDYSIDKLMTFSGKNQLKEHLRIALNRGLQSPLVEDVFIREFVFQ